MLKKLLCAATLLTASAMSFAATETISGSTDLTGVVSIAQWNDPTGTLQLDAVMVTFASSITTEGSLTNTASSTIAAPSLNIIGSASLTDGINSFALTLNDTLNLPSILGFASSGPVSLTVADSGMATYTDMATLMAYTGMGNIDFDFSSIAVSFAGGSGNLNTSISTSALGEVTVEYVTSVIPVSAPAHLALLGLGLVAFSRFRKVS